MNRFIIFMLFVYISLLVKEFPPFTKATMYSYFPDTITLFYITDKKNKIMPMEEYYNYSIFDIAHNYSSVRHQKSSAEVQNTLISKMEQYAKKTPDDSIQLHIRQVKIQEWQNFQKEIMQESSICDGIKF